MENVKLSVNGTTLTIEVDLAHRGEKSASGKTLRVASTCGNIEVPGFPTIKLGINAYTK
jgi:hypothetical protein